MASWQQLVPDLLRSVHPSLGVAEKPRLVIDGDSWSRHSASRREHDRDCVRYNELVVAGWRVLPFTYQQAMHERDYVLEILRAATIPPGVPTDRVSG